MNYQKLTIFLQYIAILKKFNLKYLKKLFKSLKNLQI